MIELILIGISLYFALTDQLLVAIYIMVMVLYLKRLVRDIPSSMNKTGGRK